MTDVPTKYTYTAFISYKRGEADEYWAKWLQRKLEAYRIPTRLVPDKDASMPARLRIFRDKTDLGSHHSLDQGLHSSLAACRFLIVICSPRSAQSPYVADEVRHFMETGREEYIIPFIIDGTPVPVDSAQAQCYPPTLPVSILGITLADGSREETLVKIIARLLRVDYASLYQRHLRAQRRFMTIVMAFMLSVLAVVSGLAVWAVNAERRATAQRKEAEGLVEFLVGDLSEEAFAYIPLRARRKITEKADQYYQKWSESTADDGRRYRARNLINQALDLQTENKFVQAKELLLQARDIMEDLLTRSPDSDSLISEAHAMYLDLFNKAKAVRDLETARDAVQKSIDLARRFRAKDNTADPETVDTTPGDRLMARSLESAGSYAWEYGDQTEALRMFRDTVEIYERLHAANPDDPNTQVPFISGMVLLCGHMRERDTETAEYICKRSLELSAEYAGKAPFNQHAQSMHMCALTDMATIRFVQLRVAEAEQYGAQAMEKARTLTAHDPEEMLWQGFLGQLLRLRAQLLQFAGKISESEAAEIYESSNALMARIASTAKGSVFEQTALRSIAYSKNALTTLADEKEIMSSVVRARMLSEQHPDNVQALYSLAGELRLAFLALRDKHSPQEALTLGLESKDIYSRYLGRRTSDIKAVLEYCAHLNEMGTLLRSMGDLKKSRDFFNESLELARTLKGESNVSEAVSGAYDGLGENLAAEGRFREALEHFQQSLAALRLAQSQKGTMSFSRYHLIVALQTVGYFHLSLGETDKGVDFYREALGLTHEVQGSAMVELDYLLYSETAGLLGRALVGTGRSEEGLDLLGKSLGLARVGGEKPDSQAHWQTSYLIRLQQSAHARWLRGEYDLALSLTEEAAPRALAALEKEKTAGNFTQRQAAFSVLREYSEVLNSLGQHEKAATLLADLLPMVKEENQADFHNIYMVTLFLEQQGAAALGLNNPAASLAAYDEGIRIISRLTDLSSEEMDWNMQHAQLLSGKGQALLAGGKRDAALEVFTGSLERLRLLCAREPRKVESRRYLLETLRVAAPAFAAAGQNDKAGELRAEAEEVRKKGEELAPGLPLWQ